MLPFRHIKKIGSTADQKYYATWTNTSTSSTMEMERYQIMEDGPNQILS